VEKFWLFNIVATSISLITGIIHFRFARNKQLIEILDQLGAIPSDKRDEYHKVFINIVHEAETATGIRPILAVVIPSAGCNAFSVEDGFRFAAIGITEGTLARLDRSELTAVVSHEATHLVSGDSRLSTIVSSILGIFDRLRVMLKRSKIWHLMYRTRVSIALVLARPFLWFLAVLGHFVTKFIYMAISRKREFLTDANAVNICKDPLSLAEAIYKISQKYRGSFDVPEGFESLFILNPQVSWLDEKRGFFANLFTTHPPVAARLKKLMTWAKTDVIEIKQDLKIYKCLNVEKEESPKFFAHIKEKWEGPFSPLQLLALDTIKPSTFVCSAEMIKLSSR